MIVRNIRNRIKLLFSTEKKLYSSLLNLTGFCPNRIELYKIALTHKSQTMRQKGRSSITSVWSFWVMPYWRP